MPFKNIILQFFPDSRTASDRARAEAARKDTEDLVAQAQSIVDNNWGSISGSLADQTDLQAALDEKSDDGHNHDDRYYTETEIDAGFYTQAQIDGFLGELTNAVTLEGEWDASSGSFPGGGSAQTGHSYQVTTAGTVDGIDFSINDRIIAVTNNASTGTYAGNWIKADYSDLVSAIAGLTGNVTTVALLSALSLDNVDNTSDADKPVSTSQQTALDGKEDSLDADQKRKITYGTTAPSGGSDGDIYLQHD